MTTVSKTMLLYKGLLKHNIYKMYIPQKADSLEVDEFIRLKQNSF